jgi:hypothetical protein
VRIIDTSNDVFGVLAINVGGGYDLSSALVWLASRSLLKAKCLFSFVK